MMERVLRHFDILLLIKLLFIVVPSANSNLINIIKKILKIFEKRCRVFGSEFVI